MIKVITYSNVLFINILLFILDLQVQACPYINFLCYNFDYYKSLSYLFSGYTEIFLPYSIIRNNVHTTQYYTVSLIYQSLNICL